MRGFTSAQGDRFLLCTLGTSLAFSSTAGFAAYLLGLPQWLTNVAFLVSVTGIGLVTARRQQRDLRFPGTLSIPVRLLVSLYVSAIAIQALLPVYAGAFWFADWWLHFDVARYYLEHAPINKSWFEGDVIAPTRTPFFNLSASYFLSLFGNEFWVFQIFSTLANSLYLVPLAVLAKNLYGRRPMLIAIFFALFSAALFSNVLFTWPKLVMAFSVLASVCFYIEFRRSLILGLLNFHALGTACAFASLAYMTHQTALYYAIGVFIDICVVCLHFNQISVLSLWTSFITSKGRQLLAGLMFLGGPWYLWSFLNFGILDTIRASPAISYAIVTDGWAFDRFSSLASTLVPTFLLECAAVYLQGATIAADHPFSQCAAPEELYNNYLRFSFDTLPGALSLTLLAVLGCLTMTLRKNALPGAPSAAPGPRIGSDGFALGVLVMAGILLGHAALPSLATRGSLNQVLPVFLLLLPPIAAYMSHLPNRALVFLMTAYFCEFVMVKGLHLGILLGGHLSDFWHRELAMKADTSVLMASDYLGPQKWLFLPVTLAGLLLSYGVIARLISTEETVDLPGEGAVA